MLVDVHSHLYPRTLIEALKRRPGMPRVVGDRGSERFVMFPTERNDPGLGRPMPERFWDLDEKLAFMDANGISHSVLSVGNPWVSPFRSSEGASLARTLNEFMAQLEPQSAGRLVGLGVVAESSMPAALAEIEWIRRGAKLRGVAIGTRVVGRTLDDMSLEPLWRELEAANLAVLIHPHYGLGLGEMDGYGRILAGALGFTFETTLALCRMALGGVFERHPRIIVIASHGAGALPYLVGRLDAGWESSDRAKSGRLFPSQYLGNIYADSAVFHQRSLRALVDLVGEEHVMFGTDHPFRTDITRNVTALDGLQATQRTLVAQENAVNLFHLHRNENEVTGATRRQKR